ncbi:MAG: S8 family serine peptidase [Dehalococcoidia bacterium]|nr:S8 family serine peptidase [Dehalococcoidia bacterium]
MLDRQGHGTHVAGIIAGSGSGSARRFSGVAPDAALLVARVLDDRGAGWSSDVMAGLDWAVVQGARVVNLSLSSEHYGDGSDALSLFCDAVVQQGVVGVWRPAMTARLHTVGAPGCARQVLTVGASTDADGIAEFSAHGPTADGRIKPDVLFPGTLITSTRARGTHMGASQGDLYTEASGTSMATAHASGVAAPAPGSRSQCNSGGGQGASAGRRQRFGASRRRRAWSRRCLCRLPGRAHRRRLRRQRRKLCTPLADRGRRAIPADPGRANAT